MISCHNTNLDEKGVILNFSHKKARTSSLLTIIILCDSLLESKCDINFGISTNISTNDRSIQKSFVIGQDIFKVIISVPLAFQQTVV